MQSGCTSHLLGRLGCLCEAPLQCLLIAGIVARVLPRATSRLSPSLVTFCNKHYLARQPPLHSITCFSCFPDSTRCRDLDISATPAKQTVSSRLAHLHHRAGDELAEAGVQLAEHHKPAANGHHRRCSPTASGNSEGSGASASNNSGARGRRTQRCSNPLRHIPNRAPFCATATPPELLACCLPSPVHSFQAHGRAP